MSPSRNTFHRNKTVQVSLPRALSKLGYCSRTQAETLITAGNVEVNGRPVKSLTFRVHPGRDKLTVDGQTVKRAAFAYWMLNKPAGVVTTRSDEKGRMTVCDLLGRLGAPPLLPAGRLDMDSEGLLLCTNDTKLADRLLSPKSHADKKYRVIIKDDINNKNLVSVNLVSALCAGVFNRGEFLKVKNAVITGKSDGRIWVEVVLDEGRNRQIRRIFETLNIKILGLKRVSLGPLTLCGLESGMARSLTDEEIRLIKDTAFRSV